MTRIASRHSGRRTSPASRRSRLKSDIGMHYCISRFTMQEQILQLSSTVKPGGATSPLPATPSRNRTNAKIKLFAKTAQYRNQISTLLGVSPLIFYPPPVVDGHLFCHIGSPFILFCDIPCPHTQTRGVPKRKECHTFSLRD